MCRIGLYATLNELNSFREFLYSFVEGSANDFVLDSIKKGRRSHNHGWGYAYVYKYLNDLGVMFYKTSAPITSNMPRKIVSLPKHFNWLVMLMHSRLTSGEPIDVSNSHPYHVHIPGKLSLWLAHNGSVKKDFIARELSMLGIVNMYSDTYFLSQWIATNISKPDINAFEDAIKHLIDLNIVETSLNLVAIVMDENNKRVFGAAVNYVVGKGLETYDYYKLYKVVVDRKTIIIASSTISLYMQRIFGFNVSELENRELVFVEPIDNELNITKRILG
uniref:Glutamine amidotransferase type-2 domain-containing protein n=1 Tax=Ignisphaera aggregans TaxID=334771 RepID=A0A7J2U4I5_9CREN